MRLLYFWKDTNANLSYTEIEKEEFNFSTYFKFKYDKKSNLIEYTKSKNYINNFFSTNSEIQSNVVDIVAIVGANGSGKTSFLESLINIPYTVEAEQHKFIFIFKSNNKIEYITNIENLKIIDKESKKYVEDDEIQEYTGEEKEQYLSKNLKYVYHSNIFEQRNIISSNNNLIDISTNSLIEKDSKYLKEMKVYDYKADSKMIFFTQEFQRQIDFIHRFNYDIPNIKINLPKYCSCNFIQTNNIWDSIVNGIKVDETKAKIKDIKDVFEKVRKILDNDRDIFKFKIVEGVMLNYISLITPSTVPQKNSIEIKTLNKVFDDFMCKNEGSSIKALTNLDEILSFLEFMLNHKEFEIYDKINNNIKMFLREFYSNISEASLSYKPAISNEFIVRVKDNPDPKSIRNLDRFYELYKKSIVTFNYINFSWPLSSGENNLLNLYARFLSILDKDGNIKEIKGKSIIFLLDESDISFHPEWQRRFISTFVNICKNIFEKYEIQIILTTHSPILLSDIPDSNVIYIKQEENRQLYKDIKRTKTFGANIFNLYNDSFYFGHNDELSIGIIGELAQSKILEMMGILDSYLNQEDSPNKVELEEQLEYCEFLMSIVGEEVIKILLYDKYKQVRNKHRKLLNDGKEDSVTQMIRMLQNKTEISNEDEKDLYKILKEKYKGLDNKKD